MLSFSTYPSKARKFCRRFLFLFFSCHIELCWERAAVNYLSTQVELDPECGLQCSKKALHLLLLFYKCFELSRLLGRVCKYGTLSNIVFILNTEHHINDKNTLPQPLNRLSVCLEGFDIKTMAFDHLSYHNLFLFWEKTWHENYIFLSNNAHQSQQYSVTRYHVI